MQHTNCHANALRSGGSASLIDSSARPGHPSQGVGLILVAALQRRRRGIHVSVLLRPEAPPPATSLPELRAARGTSMKLTGLIDVRALMRCYIPLPLPLPLQRTLQTCCNITASPVRLVQLMSVCQALLTATAAQRLQLATMVH
jgi:hypothetical protein